MSQKYRQTIGQPPGTLTYIGEEKDTPIKIEVIDYSEGFIHEEAIKDIRDSYDYKEKENASWINIDGVHNTRVIKTLGLYFNLHPLMLEDIVDTEQRPKVDFYEENIFVVLQMLSYDEKEQRVESEQVSLVLGERYLLSFQEDIEGDVFDSIRQRLRNKPRGKLRNSGVDYLFYLLMDTIVDNYFLVIENIGEDLEKLEEQMIKEDQIDDPTRALYDKKRQLTTVRKAVRPLREIVTQLIREEDRFLHANNIYLRDLQDHIMQVGDMTESYIDVCSNLMDLYLSIIGHKTNDVMKILTILSTIFLPLTFIVGVYGMNFEYMPETQTHYGYFIVWGIMVGIMVASYFYFRIKRWI